MTFQAPLLLGLLAVVPLVAAVYALQQRRARKFAVRYTNVDLLIAVAGRSWTRHLPAVLALLRGRDYMLPVDVRDLARDVLRHRIVLTYEALAAGVDADRVLDDVLERVPMPRIELAHERAYGT